MRDRDKSKEELVAEITQLRREMHELKIVHEQYMKTQDQLRESEERFRSLFNSSMVGILLTHISGNVVAANPAVCKMLGQTEEELCRVGRLGIIEVNDERTYHALEERNCTGKFLCELSFVHKDGTPIPVEVSSNVFRDQNNREFASLFVRDIRDRKRYEQEMQRLDRLNIIGQMAAGIGHEVRNPLTTVRGFLQMLSQKPKCSDYKEYLKLMIEELDRANLIITEFLSVAKSSSETMEMIDLNKLIKSISPLIQSDAYRQNNFFLFEEGKIQPIQANAKELRQVILNLSQNGLEAMSSGKTLKISTYMREEKVVLSVQDQGCGIDKNILDKIGTPFLTTKDHGTGLGLAVCYGIARRHNATIEVETSPQGTTFFIEFSGAICYQ